MILASLDESKRRGALFEYPDADGLEEEPVLVGTDPVDEEPGEEEVVLVPVALALKASKVLLAVGLTAKTIPDSQWRACLQ
jgi:hypothetical protein